ncbi:ATP synthase F1 subunit gamma [Blattabacterium cuenoti]|uniref:ATP synthase F1 subunit gamma n=1 Tax=Blattabacterium cuenoti TaxID=1653831 RepID=UPI00163C81D1|nr:ATP synthase F1 subunit gamma [Blattabacterium cuenoti]
MSNIKEIKRKISSINSVIKTTEAMKMISISKLNKYKKNLFHVTNYLNHIQSILIETMNVVDINNFFFYNTKKNNKKLFIFFTSDKGLCGSFNISIFNKIHDIIKKKKNNMKLFFFSIGKKGNNYIINNKLNIWNNNFSFKNDLKNFTIKLTKDFYNKKITSVYLIFNSFEKNYYKKILVKKLIPITPITYVNKSIKLTPILEPCKKNFLEYFIPFYIETKLKKSFFESLSSEHTLRMILMHKATENAYNMKNNLTLNYNKERQTVITKEILEIIGGLESLKNR